MNCPKCGLEQKDGSKECARCGLIFSQYRPLDYSRLLERNTSPDRQDPSFLKRAFSYLFHTKDEIELLYFAGRLVVFVLLLFWSMKFLQSSMENDYAGRSFMHLVNLPFHEAGHIVFRPFGSVMHSLGGTLGQIIMPIVCTLVLLIKTRDTFGASIALWWIGESILDIAPYIDDARSMSLQLLGGNTGASAPYGFHDWNFILTELDLLRYDHLLADAAAICGKLIISISLFWGLILIIKQFRRLNRNLIV